MDAELASAEGDKASVDEGSDVACSTDCRAVFRILRRAHERFPVVCLERKGGEESVSVEAGRTFHPHRLSSQKP